MTTLGELHPDALKRANGVMNVLKGEQCDLQATANVILAYLSYKELLEEPERIEHAN